MRAALRFLIPLLALLCAVAWAASEFMSRQAYRWAERDLGMRSRLALSGAREPLAAHLAAGKLGRARGLL